MSDTSVFEERFRAIMSVLISCFSLARMHDFFSFSQILNYNNHERVWREVMAGLWSGEGQTSQNHGATRRKRCACEVYTSHWIVVRNLSIFYGILYHLVGHKHEFVKWKVYEHLDPQKGSKFWGSNLGTY